MIAVEWFSMLNEYWYTQKQYNRYTGRSTKQTAYPEWQGWYCWGGSVSTGIPKTVLIVCYTGMSTEETAYPEWQWWDRWRNWGGSVSTGRWGRDCWQPFADTQQMGTWGWSETTSAMPVSKMHVVFILLHTSKTACYYDTDERQLLSYTDAIQNVTLIKDSMFCSYKTQMKYSMLLYYTDQRQYVLYVTKHKWKTACYTDESQYVTILHWSKAKCYYDTQMKACYNTTLTKDTVTTLLRRRKKKKRKKTIQHVNLS